jgi:hypothetical protein
MTDTCPIEGCASPSSPVPKLQVWLAPEGGAEADMHVIPVSINNHAQHHATTCTASFHGSFECRALPHLTTSNVSDRGKHDQPEAADTIQVPPMI